MFGSPLAGAGQTDEPTGQSPEDIETTNATAEAEAAAPPEPEYATRQDLDALADKLARRMQRMTDKKLDAFSRQLNTATLTGRATQALKKIGVDLRPEQVPDFLAALQEHGIAPADAPAEPAEPEPQTPDQERLVAYVHAESERLAAKYGFEAGDAELSMIRTGGDPQDYLDSIVEAGVARKARLARAQVSRPRAARVPGYGTTGRPAPKSFAGVSRSDAFEQEANSFLK